MISDYPISYPYGATDPPYSASHPHRGDDRAAPEGTTVVVAGRQIGLVGHTGLATGPHLHLQEWQGNPANTRKPQNSFQGGTVVAATQAADFGNYVTIQTADGWNDSYCHLSKIEVSVGDIIGGDPMTEEQVKSLYEVYWRTPPSAEEIQFYTGKPATELIEPLRSSARKAEVDGIYNTGVTATNDKWSEQISTLEQQLKDAQAGFTPVTDQLYKKK